MERMQDLQGRSSGLLHLLVHRGRRGKPAGHGDSICVVILRKTTLYSNNGVRGDVRRTDRECDDDTVGDVTESNS